MPVCTSCERDVSFSDLKGGRCRDCREKAEAGRMASAIKEIETVPTPEELNDPRVLALIVSTTNEIPNRQIDGIIDIVGSEAAVGLNIFKDRQFPRFLRRPQPYGATSAERCAYCLPDRAASCRRQT
ncbi:hypothetical protein [Rhizobium populisoli]|uniref:hypothetical protein n=1 Tax=Rhizobium populisoli TaxID=2859785 RepID=UPI001FEBDDDB|nr:hypothetical protein [Rhizobium populisoli]